MKRINEEDENIISLETIFFFKSELLDRSKKNLIIIVFINIFLSEN